MNSSTWNKDSNELFDYECNDLIKLKLKISNEGILIRTLDEIKFLKLNQIYTKNNKTKLLVNLECSSTQFFLKKPAQEENTETPWLVCKFLKNYDDSTGYKLSVGDVIKLGRVKLKIKEIRLVDIGDVSLDNNYTKHFATKINDRSFNDNNRDRVSNLNENQINNIFNKNFNNGLSQFNSNNNIVHQVKKNKSLCRICYCDEIEIDSPLISPCSCSGSMKYIHFSCLQKWLKSKIVVKSTITENCSSYSIKQIECELCKIVFPDFVKYKGKLYDTKEFIKPSYKTYITLESAMTDKNSNKVLFYVNLESKQNIRIVKLKKLNKGRGHDSDVRISDISVSRFHALIRKTKEDCLFLEDNISKFGTLILLQNNKINLLQTELPLQIGRSLLTFNIKKPWSFFRCFSSKSEEANIDYQILNYVGVNLEKDVIVKIQEDNNGQEEEFSIDEKKRIDVDKSEKNSIIFKINDQNLKMEEQNNIEEIKEDGKNLINKSVEFKIKRLEDQPKSSNFCFSDEMHIAEEHEKDKSELIIQNYRFFQKKTIDKVDIITHKPNIQIEIINRDIFNNNPPEKNNIINGLVI